MLQSTNNLINRANLINPPAHRSPPRGKTYDSCSRKLACFISVFCTHPPPPLSLSLLLSFSLSFSPFSLLLFHFTLFFTISPTNPRSSPTRFTPRLSSRAHSAVTKIDFLARTRERAGGKIEYIAVETQFRLLGFGRRAP